MSLKERTINVDIMTKEYTKLKYKQGDSNQTLKFKFYKNGSELDLTGYVAGIFYEKSNNEVLEKTGNINGNIVTTTITSGILNTPGVVKTEIFLTKGEEVSISFTILIEVESSIDKNSAVQEKEEWDIIKDLLINGNNISMIDDSLTATNKTWSSDKIDSQIKDIVKNGVNNSTDIIDLEKYNIIQADYSYPFTTENYNIAYQNGLGLQKAIDEAKEKGFQKITIPQGNYPLCYHASNHDEYNPIIISEDIDVYAYGCKFYVIYDDLNTGLNPYYTGTMDGSGASLMCGIVFQTNRSIFGAEIVGERKYRTNENAKYREFSCGITFSEYTKGNTIKDCKIHHFSGDSIGMNKPMQQVSSWYADGDSISTAITWDGTSFVPSTRAYTTMIHGLGFADISKPMQIKGQTYFIWTSAPLKIHCFNNLESTKDNYIDTIYVNQGEYFFFPVNTKYWCLEVTYNSEHEIDSTINIPIALGYGYYVNTTIENCECYCNTRGGISNLPSSSIIKNCKIYNNGCAYEDMPAFYDATQFGIDIEDWYIHSITVENCIFFGNLHDVLYRCNSINLIDNTFNSAVKSLNYAVNFYAKGCKFKNCIMLSPADFGTKTAINCTFTEMSSKVTVLDNVKGVPTGGGEGQVLAKNSTSDYDVVWRDINNTTNENKKMKLILSKTIEKGAESVSLDVPSLPDEIILIYKYVATNDSPGGWHNFNINDKWVGVCNNSILSQSYSIAHIKCIGDLIQINYTTGVKYDTTSVNKATNLKYISFIDNPRTDKKISKIQFGSSNILYEGSSIQIYEVM